MARTHTAGALALAVCCAFPATAHPGVELSGDHVTVGLGDGGGLVRTGASPVGLRWDPDGAGGAATSGDWLSHDGTVFAGWGFDRAGLAAPAFNDTGATDFPVTLTDESVPGAWLQARAEGSDGALTVTQVASFDPSSTAVRFEATLTNPGGNPVTDLAFLVAFDPDVDSAAFGTYRTRNDVLPGWEAVVVATGPYSLRTVLLGTSDPRATASVEAAGLWPFDDPDRVLLTPVDPGGAEDDAALGLAWDLGTLAAGATARIGWALVLDDTAAAAEVAFAAEEVAVDADGDGWSPGS